MYVRYIHKVASNDGCCYKYSALWRKGRNREPRDLFEPVLRDALRYDWVLECVPADEALERQILLITADFVVFFVWKEENKAQASIN